ncbi:MAG: hypothetical protein SVG88_04905 [Halobacteriales archaeon]|nr:hypothetical protein [Halobacteriales archaeon]
MPEITVNDEQLAYLDRLSDELAAEHAGPYSTVSRRDALQYLIDSYEGDLEGSGIDADADAAEDSAADSASASAADGDGEGDDDAATPDDEEDRLNAMMNLLETHDDKWEEAEGEDGRYAVELPDGEVEHVRTKDDVRAVLFKNY